MTLESLARITHWHAHHAGSSAAVNIHVRDLAQLLNSLDPSPFWDRDLDPIAAEFIEEEFSEKRAVDTWNLNVHVHEGGTSPTDLQAALENYYGRMASSAHRTLREHLWSSHRMLIGGVAVFLLSMGLRSALARIFGTLPQILDEGLIILAWLALWRPAEMLLYGWIPLRRKRRLYERFAGIRVFVRPDTLAPTVTSRVPITAAPRGASYKLTARTSNTGSGLSLTMYSASLLLRMGRMPLISPPRDIAEAIVFRIRSDFIIGHVIDVDGGRDLQGCPADLEPSPVHHAR